MLRTVMTTVICFLSLMATLGVDVQAQWAQVAPIHRVAEDIERTPAQKRAVVLIPGLRPHPFSSRNVTRASMERWQKPGSVLVKELGRDADVYAFAYGQNVSLEQIARSRSLHQHIRRLRQMGYEDIVLVGHSAGGIIARLFVEDHPDAGVTKVVQICTPNGGSGWAAAPIFVRRSQEPFLASITKDGRRAAALRRAKIRIPNEVEFVCLVGHLKVDVDLKGSWRWKPDQELGLAFAVKAAGDGMIASQRQWTTELQEQGVPAVCLPVGHFRMVRSKTGATAIAKLVCEKQSRWSSEQVSEFREKLGIGE
jgi:hypothetical protein